MKKITLLTAAIAMMFTACNKSSAVDKINSDNVQNAAIAEKNMGEVPVISFDKSIHDFGTLKEGDVVETIFKFTNTGKSDLIISNAKSSCGCTVPDLSKIKNKPFKPGESGEFNVKFNSKGKPNKLNKTVTVTTNTKTGKEKVQITGFVTPDPEAAAKRAEAAAKRKADLAKKKAAEAAANAIK
jgi:hypothetical protein